MIYYNTRSDWKALVFVNYVMSLSALQSRITKTKVTIGFLHKAMVTMHASRWLIIIILNQSLYGLIRWHQSPRTYIAQAIQHWFASWSIMRDNHRSLVFIDHCFLMCPWLLAVCKTNTLFAPRLISLHYYHQTPFLYETLKSTTIQLKTSVCFIKGFNPILLKLSWWKQSHLHNWVVRGQYCPYSRLFAQKI